MKIFVTDKYRIITFAMICALIGTAAFCAKNYNASETAAEVRKLPIYSVERGDGKIAVTFDCAWGADDIDSIIAALKKHNCPSTFFVIGTWAEKYPEAVKKLAAAGHEIGNHSYNHAYYTQISEEEIIADIKKCSEAVKNACGTEPQLLRAPAGAYNNTVISASEKLSMPCIQWDADSLDWKGLDAAQMTARLLPRVKSGSILLFHNDTAHTAEALDTVLTALEEKGFTFAPVSELIYKDNYTIDHTGRQIKCFNYQNRAKMI